MVKWLLYSLLLFAIGLLIIIMPGIVDYTNTDSWYVNLAQVLKDYPQFRLSFGIALLVLGLIGLSFACFQFIRQNTAFVIQQSGDGDYGNPSLSYPKLIIGAQEPLIYENVASLNRNDKSILDLDKNRITRFYGGLKDKKRIAFLGVALFPYLVYAGFVVGNAGQKVSYFHYNRNKSKSEWIYPGIKTKNRIKINQTIDTNGNDTEVTIAVSVSYSIDKEIVKKQFGNQKTVFLESEIISTEAIKNRKTLDSLANDVRKAIDNESRNASIVNLLLSCPAELCFAIGQRMSSPGLPLIKVYNFNKKSINNEWDWNVDLNRANY